jgi:hypothetical protein
MVDPAHLKELRRLTNAGLSDCKRALDDAGGDLFAAAVSMLAEDDVHSLKSSMMVRASAGQSIKDPVTDSERELINALEAHFIAQRTRPANVGFLFETALLFLTNPQFRVAIMDDPAATIRSLWNTLAARTTSASLPQAETIETKQVLSTVVKMPDPESQWECDFVILLHPRRRFVLSSKPRVLALYKRTKQHDRGVANIEEMAHRRGEVHTVKRWIHEDAVFTAAALAELAFDSKLRQVT